MFASNAYLKETALISRQTASNSVLLVYVGYWDTKPQMMKNIAMCLQNLSSAQIIIFTIGTLYHDIVN